MGLRRSRTLAQKRMKPPIYIIEHREPRLWRWCEIEYESISKTVGKDNLLFTNIRNGTKKLARYGEVLNVSVKELNLKKACILDPAASKELTPQEARSFDCFVFGGILGDRKLNKRTEKEVSALLPNAQRRNIGKLQFSTDNAVFVTHEIVRGKKLKDIPFQNHITIQINKIESVDLPYLYPLVNYKPRISPKLITYLKRKKGF